MMITEFSTVVLEALASGDSELALERFQTVFTRDRIS
jgi:hypothetical protein